MISAQEAHRLSQQGSVVFADVRWYADGRSPRQAFSERHIQGAHFIDVDADLTSKSHANPSQGRHPLPAADDFAKTMARRGIGDDSWVIAYDDTGGMTAARLVVMLRMIGRRASLLDGGLATWTDSYPDAITSGDGTKPTAAHFTKVPWPGERLATLDDVREYATTGPYETGVVLLDARASDRFTGNAPSGPGTLDPRAGHIPHALNAPWASVLSEQSGRVRSTTELREYFTQLGVDDSDDVVVYCGSGISACLDVLAIEYAGFATPRLFVPSWSGWSAVDDHPVHTGNSSLNRDEMKRAASKRRLQAVHDLRKARQRRRLAELEWFEALYRVYLAVFIFGGGIAFLSGFIPDTALAASASDDVWAHGPGWLGLIGVIAIAMGLRSGSRGGPLALEEADVRHLLLAPIERARVLLRPAVQSVRTVTFACTMAGALAGYLAARRLPGTAPTWMFWCALWGFTAGLLFVGCALLAHGARLPLWLSTTVGIGLVTWQLLSALPPSMVIALDSVGPGDLHGDLALAEHGVRIGAFAPLLVAGLVTFIGLALVGRLSIEALLRRSALVSQLRFAVTVQDLRTVTLLRRRLSQERSRRRPWLALPHNAGPFAEWNRSLQGLMRFPLSRVIRIFFLCIVAALGIAVAYHDTTPAIIVVGFVLFMVALELLEPIAQAVDQSDRTESYPHPRGLIHLRLAAPIALVIIPLVGIMTLTTYLVDHSMWVVGLIGVTSALIAASAGAGVNIVSGSPDPVNNTINQNVMPPEVAGTVSIIKALWPVAIAVVGNVPVVVAGVARDNGQDPSAAALRAAISILLLSGVIGGWIRFRDDIKRSLNNAMRDGRGYGASTSYERRS